MPDARQFHREPLPTDEILSHVMEAAPADVRLMIEVVASTGLRPGELRDMLYRHIDWDEAKLLVGYGHAVQNGMVHFIGHYRRRKVPLSQQLLLKLEKHRSKSIYSGMDDPVFLNKRGCSLRPFVMERSLRAVFDRLGFPTDPNDGPPEQKRFRWYDLRRYAVASWIAMGLSPREIQKLAGHASIQNHLKHFPTSPP